MTRDGQEQTPKPSFVRIRLAQDLARKQPHKYILTQVIRLGCIKAALSQERLDRWSVLFREPLQRWPILSRSLANS